MKNFLLFFSWIRFALRNAACFIDPFDPPVIIEIELKVPILFGDVLLIA